MSRSSVTLNRNFMKEYNDNLSAGLAFAADGDHYINEDKRVTSRTCSYCQKESPVDLQKGCPRCKATRYCNGECQRAHYEGNHRRECVEFVHPPRTRAFRTHLIGHEKYPHSPIFAHGHVDGVGCWISTANKIDCDAQQLSRRLVSIKDGDPRYTARVEQILDQPEKLSKAAKRNLTTLHVCVQNRRKDGLSVLVFGGASQVVTRPSATKTVLRGRVGPHENIMTFTRSGKKFAAVGVTRDSWSNELRVHVDYINHEAINLPPYPWALQDADQAIVALSRGEFAIMSLQFRTGDNTTIKDWQTFRLLDHVVIPFMVWDGNTHPATLASTLPPAYTLPNTVPSPSPYAVKHLRLQLDQGEITKFYKDAIDRGDDYFIRTHYGDVQAAMCRSMSEAQIALTEVTLRLANLPPSRRPVGWRDMIKKWLVGLL